MANRFERTGAKLVNFRLDGKIGLEVIPRLKGYLASQKIQLVHTHVLRPDLVGGVATRLARGPILVSTKHNMGYVRGQRGWLIRNLFYWPAMYLPDKVVTVTNVLRKQLITRMRLMSDRVITIHPGIDVAEYYRPEAREGFRRAMNLSSSDHLVTFAGRLVGGKGLDVLLESARKVLALRPACHFLVVGHGPLRELYETSARELGIANRVIFTGFSSDIPEILAGTDVFVLPSLSEGMPKSLLEAMAAGKAVVASSVGGVVELIQSPDLGLVVAPRDPVELAGAICRLLDDRSRRQKMGYRAQDYVKRNFSIDHMVSSYDSLYRDSLYNRASHSANGSVLFPEADRRD